MELATRSLLLYGLLLCSAIQLAFISYISSDVENLRNKQLETTDFYRDGVAVVLSLSDLASDTDSAKINRMKAVEPNFIALDCCDTQWQRLSNAINSRAPTTDVVLAFEALRDAISSAAETKYAALSVKKEAKIPLITYAVVATAVTLLVAYLFVLYVILAPLLRLKRAVEHMVLGGQFDFLQRRFDPQEIVLLANMLSGLIGQLQHKLSEREVALKETQRNADRNAEALAHRYHQIIERSASPIFMLNDVGIVTSWNEAISDMTRIPARAAVGRRFADVYLSADDRATFQQELTRVRQGKAATAIRLGLIGRDTSPVNLLLTLSTFGLESEVGAGVTCLGQPVDKFLRDTAKKLQKQGSDQFTSLAASAAHQVNQPLHSMRLYLANAKNRLRMKNFQPELVKEKLEGIDRELTRVDRIMEHLRDLGRVEEPLPGGFEVKQVLGRCIDLVAPVYAEMGITVVFTSGTSRQKVVGHPLTLEKAIIAILDNARDAIAEAGKSTGTITVESVATEDLVQITLCDDGVGMSPDIAQRMFDPFFTSHTDRSHLGLGLTIARDAIEQSNGEINVETGGGSTKLIIKLPTIASAGDLEDPETASHEIAS